MLNLVLGPWSFVLGPWSLVLRPWSLGIGHWALGIGALGHWGIGHCWALGTECYIRAAAPCSLSS